MEDLSHYNAEGTTLRKAQLRLLDILVEIDKVCRKNNIPYWLDFGTLLGAVRHKGFIPWDDDVDITILRKDQKRLYKALELELPKKYVVQNHKTDRNYYLAYGRVVDTTSEVVSIHKTEFAKEHNGLFVDIFPVEKGSVKIKTAFDTIYGRTFRRINHFSSSKTDYMIACVLYPPCWLLEKALRCFFSVFRVNNLIYSYAIDFFTLMRNKRVNPKTIFPLSEIEFEGHKFLCPGNYDAYLTNIYGDYMQIPPVEKRQIHSLEIKFID